MPRHLYPPVGKCIYCGETKLPPSISRFGDEHVIPLALAGNLILQEASCKTCEKIINHEIETPVCREEWGYFRSKHTIPTRNKKRRKTNVKLQREDGTSMRVPAKEYSTPVFLYKFNEARILSGLKVRADHLHWTVAILADGVADLALQSKYPDWNKAHKLKTRPHEFPRLLAKIAHSYVCAEMGLDTFTPLVTDIILGRSDDYFNTVGGTADIAPPIPDGDHITKISLKIISTDRALVIVDIRLFSATETPSYHVVVGEIDLKNPEHARAFERHRLNGRIEKIPLKIGKAGPH